MLRTALRCGIDVEAFWTMTPRETLMAIEAAAWRDQRRMLTQAWYTAALTRAPAKKFPTLERLLNPPRPATGEALEARRQEFEEAAARIDVEKLNEKMRQHASRTR